MGEVIVAAFAVLALLGVGLVGLGGFRKSRVLTVLGSALLLSLLGAWMAGLFGAALGLLAIVFWKPRRD